VKNKGKRRLFIYEFVISVHIKSLTWMISVHVKEIVRKIIRSNHLSHTSIKRNLRFSHCCMQKREKVHKIDEKGVKVECVNIQIFARTQHASPSENLSGNLKFRLELFRSKKT
jgi:hypothetical protein